MFDKINGILTVHNHNIRYFIEKHVEEYIKGICPAIDKQLLDEVGKNIARSIAWELRDDVLTSIAYRVMPKNDSEDEEDDAE